MTATPASHPFEIRERHKLLAVHEDQGSALAALTPRVP
jgi:hypothetical protein